MQEIKLIRSNIRLYMTHKRMSQNDLAKRSGLGRPHISMIMQGKRNPRPQTLLKIAKGLGIKPYQLTKKTFKVKVQA